MVVQSPPAPKTAPPMQDHSPTASASVQLRLISMSVAAVVCLGIVYLAVTQKFSAITDLFKDVSAIKVEVEEEKPPPPPPPPPPPDRPPPPPPPMIQVENPNPLAPPTPTEIPVTTEPPPPPAPPAPAVITNPRWIERPNGNDFARYYPDRAARVGREGRVVLDCVVNADGRVSCTVSSEEPNGWGFGDASLQAARRFRMSPRLENGAPSEGGRVRIPMVWRLAD